MGRNARTCGNRGCVGSTDGWKMSNCWTRFMRRKRNDSVALDRTLGGTECDRRSCDPDRALQAPPSRFSPASIDGVIRIEGKMLHPLLGAGSRGSLEVPREANLRDGFRPYKSAPNRQKMIAFGVSASIHPANPRFTVPERSESCGTRTGENRCHTLV